MIVSVTEFADIIGRSQGRVSQLIAEGLPTISRGGGGGGPAEIDTAEAIAWLLERASASSGVARERERLLKEQADVATYKRQKLEGELAVVAEVRRHTVAEFESLARLIQSAYGQLPPILVNADQETMTGRIQEWFEARLRKHIDERPPYPWEKAHGR
jgi:phage terminase Nu1 subunit (DNA packaging protein)